MSDNEFVRAKEAAKFFGVTAQTIHRWRREGLIRAYKTPGGSRRYRRSELRLVKEAR